MIGEKESSSLYRPIIFIRQLSACIYKHPWIIQISRGNMVADKYKTSKVL